MVKLLIAVSEEEYKDIIQDWKHTPWNLQYWERRIAQAQVLPNDCEILTREGYSDLCSRAAKFDDDLK